MGAVDLQAVQSLEAAMTAANLAEQRLREAIDLLPEGVVFLDAEGRYILWNQQYAKIYSTSADLLERGARFADTLRIGMARGDYPDAIGREEEWLAERLAQMSKPAARHEQRLADGRRILIEERKTSDGGTIGLRVDITDMRESEEAFRLLFERNPVAMAVYDRESRCIRAANQSAADYFGLPIASMSGLPASALFGEGEWPRAQVLLSSDSSGLSEVWQMRCAGGLVGEAVISTRLSQLEGYPATIVSFFDITERRQIEQRMEHMARHDELTGLANRAHCRAHLRAVLEQSDSDETVTMALVDLDHFKAVNDTYGHHVGDALLTDAARRMAALVPQDALLCRIGGDEFAVIFRRSSRTQAEIVSRSIITALSQPFHVQGNVLHIGATIGFATSPYDSSDPETLLRYADLALYAAKGEKRGTCRSFRLGMDAAAQEKTRLENDFRDALKLGQLYVHYQPLVDLTSGAVECFEALLRWHHPVRGSVSPDVFIPLAEEIGLIDAVGRFVLHTACREAQNWPEHIKLAVNVSPLQFRNGNLISTVINALTSANLPPERLELEITEAVLMEKGPRPSAIIRNLRTFGIGIALDDFGTGFSSLSYLLNYPFTKIKIDKSFIFDLERESNSRAVIRAVIGLARNLGLTVTAEGIEREAVRDYLRDEGCLQGQGYLFGRPSPASEMQRYLSCDVRRDAA
ncbi:diguanylate cyclase (GGDEF)-like protein/PAS domain S-box-containing protein [Novosphingobium chloroacetimidivorans]|uniref:Diguanylate cyclase (GGDEF)-like protein/PAS domain S-box-containing protein n=1 Tax=Novosphingobium chloroacetimidivorans TaxID=1428314 RepID=A0A7W7K9K2_9SPHN|nr:EAL domain-containing protein [Novosphingobium chloroacetimidivorans]MBB4858495.1 diguanylate cyclase (GGDEF)-like protein/PAS domain S-box-containing protein [Novosphingobium chloroacetimidivorans]